MGKGSHLEAVPSVTRPRGRASRGRDEDAAQHGPPTCKEHRYAKTFRCSHPPLRGTSHLLQACQSRVCVTKCGERARHDQVWAGRHIRRHPNNRHLRYII